MNHPTLEGLQGEKSSKKKKPPLAWTLELRFWRKSELDIQYRHICRNGLLNTPNSELPHAQQVNSLIDILGTKKKIFVILYKKRDHIKVEISMLGTE